MSKSSKSVLVTDVAALLRPAFHAVYRAVESNLQAEPVSVPARGLLELLADQVPRTPPQIARALRIPRQFALTLVSDLDSLGLVHRIDNPEHKRSRFVAILPAGLELISRVKRQEWEALRPLANTLSEDDLEAAKRVLSQFVAYFDQYLEESHEEN